MPQLLEEREPGVYVRSNRPDQELDFLWDRERKRSTEHDRFHLGFFAAGVAVGSVITFAACFLFFAGSSLLPSEEDIMKGPLVEEQVLTPSDLAADEKPAAAKAEVKVEAPKEKALSLPFMPAKAKEEPKTTAPEVKARSYEVQNGDTLGSIAIKFYESSNPTYIEKIQRANKMESADSLQLGQRLIIPPKSY